MAQPEDQVPQDTVYTQLARGWEARSESGKMISWGYTKADAAKRMLLSFATRDLRW